MFKFIELVSKISSIAKPTVKASRGFNVAYDEPEDNKSFLQFVADNNFK